MNQVIEIEVGDDGGLRIPPDMLGEAAPHTRYRVEQRGDTFVVTPATQEQMSPADAVAAEAWIAGFLRWVDSIPPTEGPSPTDESLRRENMYD